MGHAVVAHNLFINGPAETKDDLQASLKILFEEFELLEVKNNIFYDNQALPDLLYNPLHGSTVELEANLFLRADPASRVVRYRTRDNTTWYVYDSDLELDLVDLFDGQGSFVSALAADPLLSSAAPGAGLAKTLRPGSPCIDSGVVLGPELEAALHPDTSWIPLDVITAAQSDSGVGWEVGPYAFSAFRPVLCPR